MSTTTFVTVEDARSIHSKKTTSVVDWYFGELGLVSEEPQAFRINRGHDTETVAHFHHVDQFQIFFGSPDTFLANHKTGALLLHYSDLDTLYGPFGGTEPFKLMTLRAKGTDFQGTFPDDKEKMSHNLPKRHFSEDLSGWLDKPIPSTGKVVTTTLIEEKPDRLAAWLMIAPPGVTFSTPSPVNSGGQYLVVLTGELQRGNELLPENTVGWANSTDDELVVTAGEQGVRLAVLQFGASNAKAA